MAISGDSYPITNLWSIRGELYVPQCFSGFLTGCMENLTYYGLLAAMNNALRFPLIGHIGLIRPIRLIRLIGYIRPIGLIFSQVACFLGMVFSRPRFFDKKIYLRRILAHTYSTFAA